LARREAIDGFMLRRMSALNVIERRFGVTFPIVSPLVLLTMLRQAQKAEIVHIHDVFYPLSHAAFLAALILRKPFYLTQHVALVEHPSRIVMGVERLIYSAVGRRMFRRARAIVVYNANVMSFLVSMGIDTTKVILNYNGIDTNWFSPCNQDEKNKLRIHYGLPPEQPVVLFVGRLVPKKGYDLVLEAASNEHTTLVVGEGARTRPSRPGVVMFGPADRTQLRDIYRLSDIIVLPAVGEILTLVMQEAMSSGLPVVTTDDQGYSQYGLDRSLVALVPREPAAIGQAVRRVLESPSLRDEMSRYSRRLALERFSWELNYPTEYAMYGLGPEVLS
jgi:D-inositol-3-phosphate glycosyltransferase